MNRFPLSSHELAGSNADDIAYIVNPGLNPLTLKACYLSPNLAVAASDTNYITVNIKKGATTIATLNTTVASGAAHVAGVPQAFTITGTGDDLVFNPGDVVTVEVSKTGTGPDYAFTCGLQCEPGREEV